MFRACFVARIHSLDHTAELFCQYRHPDLAEATALPSVANLGQFCFPLGPDKVIAKEYASAQSHSYTLTGGDGSHLHGFCRTFLPPRTNEVDARGRSLTLRFPQVLCIISPFPWLAFYSKVLCIVEQFLREQGLLHKTGYEELPSSSYAALFLDSLLKECKAKPQLGRIITVSLPKSSRTCISPQRRIQGIEEGVQRSLQSTRDFVELQIPPDTGNGSWNAGIPLADLLWYLPPDSLLALLQALLLERRILLVSKDRNVVSTAVHAAAALLYPFRWQHIFLPILPHSLKDYLTAPMPYLIGLPSPLALPGFPLVDLEEVVCVDLDMGTCSSGELNGVPLDHSLLPWSHHLKDALQSKVYPRIQRPPDYENTALVGMGLQEYFLKLLANYREFVEVDEPDEQPAEEVRVSPGQRRTHQDDGYLRLHGYRFDHLSFVESQRRSEKAKKFLDLMRHSQMYEVFINERMALAAGGFQTTDAFEGKVAYLMAKKGNVTRRVAQVGAKGVSNFSAMLQRTSTLVKSGVSQIRHTHSIGDAIDLVKPGHHAAPPSDPIVPSYTIDMEQQALPPQVSSSALPAAPPQEVEPAAFFDHDPDAEDDAPEKDAEKALAPLRQRYSMPASPPGSAHEFPSVASPRAAGPESYETLLNLDGVDGVFLPTAAYAQPSHVPLDSDACLLDEQGGAPTTDLSSWGLGISNSASEAASAAAETVSTTVAEWASKVQALALTLTGNESDATVTPEPTPTLLPGKDQQARGPSYDLTNAASLGTIDAFQEFKTPEAVRASSIAKACNSQSAKDSTLQLQIPGHLLSPAMDSSPSQATRSDRGFTQGSFRGSHNDALLTGRKEASSLRSSERSPQDPFSMIDPIARRDARQPMSAYKTGHNSA